jgi:putative SOS response-associated peptidase YedK
MPVIIAPTDYERGISEELDTRDLLKTFASELTAMCPISTRVNRPVNDDPSILDPVEK